MPAATTQPSTLPVTQPTAPKLEVQEWAVFVIDGATGQMNPDGMVAATLPPFVNDHRYGSASVPAPAPPANNGMRGVIRVINGVVVSGNGTSAVAAPQPVDMDQPSPVGVIRLVGSVDTKVDVSLSAKDGTFLGSGPKAQDRANQLLWRDLTVSTDPPMPLAVAGPDNWFTQLRSVNSAYVSMEHVGCDKFLVYDVQMPYGSPLKINAGSDFADDVTNITAAKLKDLTLYEGDQNTWRMGYVGDVGASDHPQSTKQVVLTSGTDRLGVTVIDVSTNLPRAKALGYNGNRGVIVETIAASSPSQGKLEIDDLVMRVNGKLLHSAQEFASDIAAAPVGKPIKMRVTRKKTATDVEILPTGAPASSTPTTAPSTPASTAPATMATASGRRIKLVVTAATQPAQLADAWKPRIAAGGVDPTDASVISKLIEQYAFDSHRLSAVYVMDDAEFDRLLPLEVVPQPAKIQRFGLVIVINADPSRGTLVDDLITQLGDDDWSRRDAAYHQLATMGPAASDKLTAASKSTDLEVAWRAERLLSLMPGK